MVPGIPRVDHGNWHENLVDVLDNNARYSTMSKGKNVSNVLANGVIFSQSNIQTHTPFEVDLL